MAPEVPRRAVLRALGVGAAAAVLTPISPSYAEDGESPDCQVNARAGTRAVFDQSDMAFHGGNGVADATNEQALYSWQESAVLQSYVLMYRAHRDTYYLDKFIQHADLVLAHRDSERGVVDYRGLSLPAWRNFNVTVGEATPMLIGVDTGNITYGLTTFARVVLATQALRENATYLEAAERYLRAAEQAIAVHDEDYVENSDGIGTYIFQKGSPYVVDGIEYPVNMNLAMGRSILSLWFATRRAAYRERAVALARHWRADWQLLDDKAIMWSHQHRDSWPYRGWAVTDGVSVNMPSYNPNTRVEDLAHGAVCVEFAELAGQAGIYQRTDLTRFARTLTSHAMTTDSAGQLTVYERIDGSRNDAGSVKQEVHSGLWLCLAPYADGPLVDNVGTILEQNIGTVGGGSLPVYMLAIAFLNHRKTCERVSAIGNTPPVD